MLIILYVLEGVLCIGSIVLVLQCLGLIEYEVIPWRYIELGKSIFDSSKKSTLNSNPGGSDTKG